VITKSASFSSVARLLVLLAAAFWLGGLTFYAAVVIPTAREVLGSHTDVGFITQRVTNWINVAGGVASAVFLINLISLPAGRRAVRIGLTVTWAAISILQAGLIGLHPVLDRMLDASSHQVVDEDHFYSLHRAYLIMTMAQQCAGLVHVYCLLRFWQSLDRTADD
jgi:hypothetical protein